MNKFNINFYYVYQVLRSCETVDQTRSFLRWTNNIKKFYLNNYNKTNTTENLKDLEELRDRAMLKFLFKIKSNDALYIFEDKNDY